MFIHLRKRHLDSFFSFPVFLFKYIISLTFKMIDCLTEPLCFSLKIFFNIWYFEMCIINYPNQVTCYLPHIFYIIIFNISMSHVSAMQKRQFGVYDIPILNSSWLCKHSIVIQLHHYVYRLRTLRRVMMVSMA